MGLTGENLATLLISLLDTLTRYQDQKFIRPVNETYWNTISQNIYVYIHLDMKNSKITQYPWNDYTNLSFCGTRMCPFPCLCCWWRIEKRPHGYLPVPATLLSTRRKFHGWCEGFPSYCTLPLSGLIAARSLGHFPPLAPYGAINQAQRTKTRVKSSSNDENSPQWRKSKHYSICSVFSPTDFSFAIFHAIGRRTILSIKDQHHSYSLVFLLTANTITRGKPMDIIQFWEITALRPDL